MAQHDYVIANGTGAAVRSDLNNALAAIVSNNSGATEPATMYAYQWWADTTTGLLKLRNAANNAWITLRELDGTLTIEDGTASSPGLAFADDLNTGIYSPSADQLGITTGGTVRLTTTTTGITSALPVDVPLGTASAPTVTFTGDLDTGIYSPGANQVAISTNGSGRLFVDSSGNVTINGQGDLRLADSDSSNWVAFQAPATVASNVTWTLPAADGTSAQVLSTNGSGTLSWASVSSDKISEGNTEAEVVDTGSDGHFKVTTEGSERLRVDPSGRLLVGTSSSSDSNALLQVYKASGNSYIRSESASLSNGNSVSYLALSSARSAEFGVYKHAGITNPGPYLYLGEEDGASAYYWTDNSGNFRVSNNGDHIGTTSGTVVGTQTSDERLKNIIGPVEYGLDTINQLEPVRFALKSEPDTEKLGFIAQQVQPLIPQSVFDTKEHIEGEPEDAPTKLGMEYVALIPVLVNAIKELSAEVDALKAQLA